MGTSSEIQSKLLHFTFTCCQLSSSWFIELIGCAVLCWHIIAYRCWTLLSPSRDKTKININRPQPFLEKPRSSTKFVNNWHIHPRRAVSKLCFTTKSSVCQRKFHLKQLQKHAWMGLGNTVNLSKPSVSFVSLTIYKFHDHHTKVIHTFYMNSHTNK